MADDDAGGVLPVFDPDAMSGPRRATFKPVDPVPVGEDGTPAYPPLPPWLSSPAPDPDSAQLVDAPPPPPATVADVSSEQAGGPADPAFSAADPATGAIVRLMSAEELGDVLEATLSTGSTLAALEQFEQQLRLRGVVADAPGGLEPPEPSGPSELSGPSGAPAAPAAPEEVAPAEESVAVAAPPELIEPAPIDPRIDLSGFGLATFPPTDIGTAPAIDPEPEIAGGPDIAPEPDIALDDPPPSPLVPQPPIAPTHDAVVVDDTPSEAIPRARAPRILEAGGLEPTPEDLRVGRAARMFWLWFPVNASLVVAALGAALMPADGSLRQAILAALIGVALAFIPVGFATMIAKRSGQPTMVASRAVFGHRGNILPSLIALVTRVLLAGALVWFAALGVAGAVAHDVGGDTAVRWLVLSGVLAVVVAAALLGARVIAIVQLVLTVLSAATLIGFVALTIDRVDLAEALQRQDGPWLPVLGGSMLVLSVVGLAWAMSGGDLARYQRSATGSTGSMLWSTIGATLPAFALIAYGAMLTAGDPALGAAIMDDPVGAIAGLLPAWAVIPGTLAIGGALASGAIIALYSAGLAVLAAGVNAGRPAATAIATVAVVVVAAGFTVGVVDGAMAGFIAVLPVAVVPVAAWTGIIAGDAMVRVTPVPVRSLLHRGGSVPDVIWGSLIGLVVLTAVGWGLVDGAPFTGWLLPLLGPAGDAIATADLGVLIALVLAIPVGVVVGVRSGRAAGRQGAASASAPADLAS